MAAAAQEAEVEAEGMQSPWSTDSTGRASLGTPVPEAAATKARRPPPALAAAEEAAAALPPAQVCAGTQMSPTPVSVVRVARPTTAAVETAAAARAVPPMLPHVARAVNICGLVVAASSLAVGVRILARLLARRAQ